MMRRLVLTQGLLGLLLTLAARRLRRLATDLIDLPTARPPDGRAPLVSVIVPARNEECNVACCVRSLLAQDYPTLEVIAVDDNSTDGTGAVLTGLAMADSRLRVVPGKPLPIGWIGKPWAAHQGASAARGEWLLFTDADTVHRPGALAAAVAFARERRLDLLSVAPRQEFGSLAERALLPGIFGIIVPASGLATGVPQRNGKARALGQCLLIRRDTYCAVGGHHAVRAEMVEDFRLGRLVGKAGGRLGFVNGRAWVSARMYHGLREIWHGFTKNVFPAAAEQPMLIPAGLIGIPILTLLPVALLGYLVRRLLKGDRRPAIIALTAVAGVEAGLVVGYSLVICRYLRLPHRYALAFPLGAITLVAILLDSARRHLLGHDVVWKGRVYRAGATESQNGNRLSSSRELQRSH